MQWTMISYLIHKACFEEKKSVVEDIFEDKSKKVNNLVLNEIDNKFSLRYNEIRVRTVTLAF